MKRYLPILPLLALGACDSEPAPSPMVDRLALAIEDADLTLLDAIEAAEAARPGAVVVSAEIELDHEGDRYEIDLYVERVLHELDLDPDTGDVLASEAEDGPEDEIEAEQTASKSVGWPALIAAAEAEVGGTAFEAETEGGDDRFEIEVLTDEGVWEVELDINATVLGVELEDDDAWEEEEELEDEHEHEGP